MIVTVKVDSALLSVVRDAEMILLKVITDNASTIIWVTGVALLDCKNPDMALAAGFSRVVMLE